MVEQGSCAVFRSLVLFSRSKRHALCCLVLPIVIQNSVSCMFVSLALCELVLIAGCFVTTLGPLYGLTRNPSPHFLCFNYIYLSASLASLSDNDFTQAVLRVNVQLFGEPED